MDRYDDRPRDRRSRDEEWKAAQRPNLPIPVFNVLCLCGRRVYATSGDSTWKCRSCDEPTTYCYCPPTPELAQ